MILDKKRSIQISSIYDSNLNLYSDLLLPGGVSNEHLGFYSADFLCAEKDLILEGTAVSYTHLFGKKYSLKKNVANRLVCFRLTAMWKKGIS